LLWSLVYAPEGTLPAALVQLAGAMAAPMSLYEPNQNVIMSGLIDSTVPPPTPVVAHSRLARNLQSNDSIVMIFTNAVANPAGVGFAWQFLLTFNYAITY
jgi:hypothetical protein